MKKQERSTFETQLTKPFGRGYLGKFIITAMLYDCGSHYDGEDRYGADIETIDYEDRDGLRTQLCARFLYDLECAGKSTAFDDICAATTAHAQSYWEEKNAQAVTAHVDRREPMHEYKPDSETLHG